MTDPAETYAPSTAAPSPPPTPDGAPPAPPAPEPPSDDRLATARQDAARYRTRLRETEATLEQQGATLAAMRRAEVERLATTSDGSRVVDPSDLWGAGLDVAQVLGDDGLIDRSKLTAAVDAVQTDHPHWFQDPRARDRQAIDDAARRGGDPSAAAGARPRPAPEKPAGLGALIQAHQNGIRSR